MLFFRSSATKEFELRSFVSSCFLVRVKRGIKMWAYNDNLYEREDDDDWVYPPSPDTDEEQQEEEDWKEIEVELFSQLHYNSKQLDGASASENPPNTLDEGDPMRVIRRPLLRNTDVRATRAYHCDNCNEVGHLSRDCNQKSTTRGPLVTSNCIANTRIYCYNCGEKGHYGFECMKDPMNPFVYSRYPFVVNYDSCWANTENESKRRKIEPDTSGYTFNIPDAMKNVIGFSKSTRKRKRGSKPAEDSNAYFISSESKKKNKSKRTKMQRFRCAAKRRMASAIRKST
ncbi:AIR1_2 [Acanthosepion pharaonis]|uniref:AIR1_2 n=1 Tax=Acanthosepion pharaonis TaxID=158019 RepID=A0A812B9G7_ACAPH|nr:AIR1_2 [Sepia pharaonis]